jgi:hypothetical protein
MLDDVELRELRIFLAVLVAAMCETGAQRPGAGVRAGCPLPWPASPPAAGAAPPAAGAWPPGRSRPSAARTVNVDTPVAAAHALSYRHLPRRPDCRYLWRYGCASQWHDYPYLYQIGRVTRERSPEL